MKKWGIILGLIAVLATVVAAPSAGAKGREVVKRGGCSGAATWNLKVKADDGRLETEFEVDQNRNGRRWRVTLFHNGARVATAIKTTTAPSGSFEFRRLVRNAAGTDRITAKAVALGNGQTCRGAARF